MVLCIAIAALFIGTRWLTARALKIRPYLLPREGALWARGLVALAGPVACLLVLVSLAFTVGLIWGVQRPAAPAVVSVHPDSPGAQAGLHAADRIVAIEGQAVQAVPEVLAHVQATAGRPFSLEIERAGTHHQLTAQARLEGGRYRIGVQLDGSGRLERGRPGLALQDAVQLPFRLCGTLFRTFAETIQGRGSVELAGPVGIVRSGQQTGSPAHVAMQLAGFWLLLSAVLGLVISVVLLLAVRPRHL